MPIFPGVDGVLFELLLVAPRVAGNPVNGRRAKTDPKACKAPLCGQKGPHCLAHDQDADAGHSSGTHRGQGGEYDLPGVGRVSTGKVSTDGVSTGRVSTGRVSSGRGTAAGISTGRVSPMKDSPGRISTGRVSPEDGSTGRASPGRFSTAGVATDNVSNRRVHAERVSTNKDSTAGVSTGRVSPAGVSTGRVSTGSVSTEGASSARACVGAVALLLSEVAANWRTMESPLFDSAGCVVGNIKMVARVEGTVTAAKPNTAAAVVVKAAGTAEEPPSMEFQEGAWSHQKQPQGGLSLAVPPRACFYRNRGVSTPVSSITPSGGLDRLAGSTGGEVEQHTAVQHVPVDSEMPPRATILYRGLCLPFHWFRSSTVEAMDGALRDALGELAGKLESNIAQSRYTRGAFLVRAI